MPAYFAADVGLFENDHRLPNLRLRQPHILRQMGQPWAPRKAADQRDQIMHRMADFVDGLAFGLLELPCRVERLFLEKAAHIFRRGHEVSVDLPQCVLGGEDRPYPARIKRMHHAQCPIAQGSNFFCRLELRQQQVAVVAVKTFLISGQHGSENAREGNQS